MRILVADDKKEIVDILELFLKKKGYEVDTAQDGKAAAELLLKNDYDIAFFDHNMPEMTGLELVKLVKANNLKTKTVILTGYPTMRDFLAKSVGADEYLNKPCQLKEVDDIVKKYS
jgi:DNA-binding response OmpR family regulator